MPYFTGYRARVSAALQNTDMYTDIALLPAYPDMWSEVGVKTEPFPDRLNVPYMTLVWEAIHKNGGGCDYTSEIVLGDSTVQKRQAVLRPRNSTAHTLPAGTGQHPARNAAKLYDFVKPGRTRLLHRENSAPVARLPRLQTERREGSGVDR